MSNLALRDGDLLAVYGLLRPAAGGLEHIGAPDAAERVGSCLIPGVLYDLGAYPGLTAGDGAVVGDLLRLRDARAGPALDAFEDFDPAAPDGSAYVRAPVRLIRPALTAWVYLWRGETGGRALVQGGDWLAHVGRSGAD